MQDLKDIPNGALTVAVRVAALGATADAEQAVFYAGSRAYKILSASFVPDTALTGADTDNRSLSFIAKGTDGQGTTAIKAAKAYNANVNIAAFDADELISASDSKTVVAGGVVSFKSVHGGSSGLAQPAGQGRTCSLLR